MARVALFNDDHYAHLRQQWGRAVIWVISAFALVFVLVATLAPNGIE